MEIGKFAEIGKSAKIGKSAEIGEFAKIGESAKIGKSAKIGEFAEIGECRAMFAMNLYKYVVSAYRNKDGKDTIQLGCYLRLREEWDADFWNNPNEFPDNGSGASNARLRAYKTACFFLDNLPK